MACLRMPGASMSRELLVIGLLFLLLTRSRAGGAAAAATPSRLPSVSQNPDLWLKMGALRVGGEMLRDLGRAGMGGAGSSSSSSSSGSVWDAWTGSGSALPSGNALDLGSDDGAPAFAGLEWTL